MKLLSSSKPRSDGFYMPAEWSEHRQTWLLWPERPDNWRMNAKPVQELFLKIIEAISAFEPVSIGVSAAQYGPLCQRLLAIHQPFPIRVVEISSNDAWCRDTGPTFICNCNGQVRGVDWTFNAWGGNEGGLYFPWDMDDQVASKILAIEGLGRYRTEGFILEGGSIHVDGEGTLLTTEECLLNLNRNPQMDRQAIEQKLSDCLGINKVLWLESGIVEDETDGHIDNMACFVKPGEIALAWTDDTSDAQYRNCRAALDRLESFTDAHMRRIKVHKLPLPKPLYATAQECAGVLPSEHCRPRFPGSRLAASYVNFYLCNRGLVLPIFDDPHDQQAADILQDLFPDRTLVTISSRELLLGGGNIHCITQQQPY